ncbi:MAG: TadE/TadG family type IV pilus assembly protein [Tepidibacillus sp.]
MIKRILKDERGGGLAGLALVLPIISLIIFFGFDLAGRSIVYQAALSGAREAARSYAQNQDLNLAKTYAEEAFNSQAGNFGTFKRLDISVVTDFNSDYVKATVVSDVTNKSFEFAWDLIGSTPNNEIENTFINELEIQDGSGIANYN